jgi:F-type H+-transporting ATPase subunit c
MDYQFALALSLPIGLGLGAFGVGMGLGRAVGEAMAALGRQPEAMTKILIVMVTGCALIEAVVIYVMVFVYGLAGKIGHVAV